MAVDFVVQHLVNSCISRNLDSFCFSFSMNVLRTDLSDQQMFDWSTCFHHFCLKNSLWEIDLLVLVLILDDLSYPVPPPPPNYCMQEHQTCLHRVMKEMMVEDCYCVGFWEDIVAAVVRAADNPFCPDCLPLVAVADDFAPAVVSSYT